MNVSHDVMHHLEVGGPLLKLEMFTAYLLKASIVYELFQCYRSSYYIFSTSKAQCSIKKVQFVDRYCEKRDVSVDT